MQRLGSSWVREGFGVLPLVVLCLSYWCFMKDGGIETRNREMSNKAVSMGVDRFENLLVRELIKLCD